jgi:hypothetical protein
MAKPCPDCGTKSDYPGFPCAACRHVSAWGWSSVPYTLPPDAKPATDWTTVTLRVSGVMLIVAAVVWAVV